MPTTLLRHVAHIAQQVGMRFGMIAAMAFVLTFSVDARADAQKRSAAPPTPVAHESKPGAARATAKATAKTPAKAKAAKPRLAKARAAPRPSANTKNAKYSPAATAKTDHARRSSAASAASAGAHRAPHPSKPAAHTPKHEPKPKKDSGNAAPRASA